jgi:hypothetical protein
MTDPSKVRGDRSAVQRTAVKAPRTEPPEPKLKPVPEAAVAAVGDTLRGEERFRDSETGGASGASGATNGLAVPTVGGGKTFLQAKTANEVLKAQERRIRLQKLKGELIERARALALVFRLAREVRDAWVNWPARAAALMAAELGVEPAAMQKVLEKHVRAHRDALAEVRPDF